MNRNPDVDEFIKNLEHPLKKEIEMIILFIERRMGSIY